MSKVKDTFANLFKGNTRGAASMFSDGISGLMGGSSSSTQAVQITRHNKSSNADVISLSGCKDKQTSADTYVQGITFN